MVPAILVAEPILIAVPDSNWGHRMKTVLSSRREEEIISNSLSLPNSPLRNSAVFTYEEQSSIMNGWFNN